MSSCCATGSVVHVPYVHLCNFMHNWPRTFRRVENGIISPDGIPSAANRQRAVGLCGVSPGPTQFLSNQSSPTESAIPKFSKSTFPNVDVPKCRVASRPLSIGQWRLPNLPFDMWQSQRACGSCLRSSAFQNSGIKCFRLGRRCETNRNH